MSVSALSAGAGGGSTGTTPHLDGLVAEASWAGTGVAAASWCLGSLASVFTGLPPSLHGAGHPGHPWLRPAARTLAEELAALGFATQGFYGTPWLGPGFGLERGFDGLRPLRRSAAERYLAALGEGPSLTWIQVPWPGAPPASELAGAVPALRSVRDRGSGGGARSDIAALSTRRQQRIAEADRHLGRLLDALRRSGRWDRSIVVVLSDHGEGRGESGAALPGTEIGRGSVEVPVAIRVPMALVPRIRAPQEVPIGLDRIFATLVELAGGRPAPAAAPSLLRPLAWPATSELWFANGYHEVAIYEEKHQLRWRCRFAAPEAAFEEARLEALAGSGSARFGQFVTAFEAEFRRRPGCADEDWVLDAWSESGAVAPADDPARAKRMLERLRMLRSFPPSWSVEPVEPRPALSRRELLALAGWGLPVPVQWAAPP
ncbi:MAG TPA: sulfatase-like hydrolase/transferase [Thermoanaerobaculia bacterium]|nr:sulfatase-like hydrolase/transferase [Thermoanaerobaculia bacterium]